MYLKKKYIFISFYIKNLFNRKKINKSYKIFLNIYFILN